MIVGPKFPLYRPAPRWLLLGLLAAEGFLMLSERFEWFAFGKHKGWLVLICLGAVGGVLSLGLLCLLACVLFRRRFQFTIRSMLVLTFAIAVACSWLAVEMQQARKQRELLEWFHQRWGGRVWLIYCLVEDVPAGPAPTSQPGWLEELLGQDFFADVIYASFSGGQDSPPATLSDSDLRNSGGSRGCGSSTSRGPALPTPTWSTWPGFAGSRNCVCSILLASPAPGSPALQTCTALRG